MSELKEEANLLARKVLPSDQYEPISERTIRYWISQDLLPRSGGPRRAALYSPEVVHLCVFIRRLQKLELLTLAQIRIVLANLDSASICRIVETNEPIEMTHSVAVDELEQRVEGGERMIALEARSPRGGQSGGVARDSDKPRQLDNTSDLEKSAAIESALKEMGVTGCEVEIRSIAYDRFLPRGTSFKDPARWEILIKFPADNKVEDPFGAMRAAQDAQLCLSIGNELSSLVGEALCVELGSKDYRSSSRLERKPECRLIIMIAKDVLG